MLAFKGSKPSPKKIGVDFELMSFLLKKAYRIEIYACFTAITEVKVCIYPKKLFATVLILLPIEIGSTCMNMVFRTLSVADLWIFEFGENSLF